MVKKKIAEALAKIDDQTNLAGRFLNENRIDEALYFIWLAAENLVNTLKIAINRFYVKDHREKSLILKEYYVLGYLNRDYSELFERLAKFRIAAEFHPYTSIPKSYTKDDVLNYLKQIEELREEVIKYLKKRGLIK
ncbi:MAG: hypothetical protein DRO98_03405 [Archaeoglobales archaeon]|nr:MAG: hypothetical protein DRO98_03405 [Archaeoglobales archaeon]